MSRPSTYNQETADIICERLANGESLRRICIDEAMPAQSTVFRWLTIHSEFSEQYARAREAQADTLFDEILDIVDDGSNDWMRTNAEDNEGWKANGENIQRSRLRLDARKWMAGKLRPKKYGDKVEVEHGGSVDSNVTHHGEVAISGTAAFVAQALGAGAEAASTQSGED